MPLKAKPKSKGSFFVYMHPLQRMALSGVVAAIVFLFIRSYDLGWKMLTLATWDAFAITYIAASWYVFFKKSVTDIAKLAKTEDGSRVLVMITILISSFGGMLTVLLLMISSDESGSQEILKTILSLAGIIASWLLLHSVFTFHYAHLYYSDDVDSNTSPLDFPNEKKPDYIDFAYFSFVIGMTFQVSDVQINSRVSRRTALAHGLLAFALNTFVVALTINLLAGLKKDG